MDRWQVMLRSMARTWELQGIGAPGGRVVELPGITASVSPGAPDRSVANSVVVRDFALLDGAALESLAGSYEEAGVRAWTVWVPEHEDRARELLAAAGHKLDASPAAMLLSLDELAAPREPAPEYSRDWDVEAAGRVNDAAYGDAPGLLLRALGDLPPDAAHMYLASVDGEPASFVLVHDCDGDCAFWIAATIPAARGRGLLSGLLHRALVDARERGCATSTTQATKMGEPVYERLGYRTFGRIEMWERRKPRPDA